MRKFILFIIATFFLTSTAHAASFNKKLSDFDTAVKETMDAWNLPGLAIAIVKDGEIVYIKGHGVKQIGNPDKVNTHTVFQIASLTKTFTSTLVGMMAEQRKLSFNTPISKFKPDLVLGSPEQTQKITLKHVLSHTTGFPGYAGDPSIESGQSYENILDTFTKLKILYEPGMVHDYQNVIYSIAGDALVQTLDKPYEKIVEEYIFEPLQMTDASVGKEQLLATSNRAYPYIYNNYKKQHVEVPYSTKYYTVSPAAGINASISDLAKWLKFQMGDSGFIMSPDTLKKLQSPVAKSPSETWRMRPYTGRVSQTHYGMGWRIYDYAGHTMVNHGGMLNGFKSILAFLPDQNVGIVLLSNSTSKALGILRSTFFDAFLDLPKVDWNDHFADPKDKKKMAAKR